MRNDYEEVNGERPAYLRPSVLWRTVRPC